MSCCNYSSDPGGYRWPPTYSIWTRSINSFSFSASAQLTIYTGTNGYLDILEIAQVRNFLVRLREYLIRINLSSEKLYVLLVHLQKKRKPFWKRLLRNILNFFYFKKKKRIFDNLLGLFRTGKRVE